MEEQIDTEMKKMDELDDDDIEKIRQRRLKAMQKAHQAKQVIFRRTHGGKKLYRSPPKILHFSGPSSKLSP